MKPKLLIVDDDAAITQQLFWTLCDDFEVMTAKDLASAVRRTSIFEPHFVILDLHLPPTPDSIETGLRILDHIKGHLPSTEVFVVSSETAVESRRECIDHGADSFLNKPLDIEHLVAHVRRAATAQRFAVV